MNCRLRRALRMLQAVLRGESPFQETDRLEEAERPENLIEMVAPMVGTF